MLDEQGRITIGKDLLSEKEYIQMGRGARIFYDAMQKRMLIRSIYVDSIEELYFIAEHKIDKKGRMYVPASIRNAFPGATYLPAKRNDRIYILIIEHEKKSE